MDNLKPAFIQINKIDAVLRQLETAVELWFNEKDHVSIHTLASAAYQILYDLNKHHKGPLMMPDSNIVAPNMRKEWRKAFKAWPNFLKHADKDPDNTIQFNPETNIFLLFDAVLSYNTITKKTLPPILCCFFMWMFDHHPLAFQSEIAESFRKKFPINKNAEVLNRTQFFKKTMQVISIDIAYQKALHD